MIRTTATNGILAYLGIVTGACAVALLIAWIIVTTLT